MTAKFQIGDHVRHISLSRYKGYDGFIEYISTTDEFDLNERSELMYYVRNKFGRFGTIAEYLEKVND